MPDWAGMLRTAQSGASGEVHLLGQQTRDGAHVYALIDSPPHAPGVTTTLYIDAHTYDLLALDSTTIDASGHLVALQTVRVLKDTSVPLSKVPASVFTFAPPAGTTIHRYRYHAGQQQFAQP